MKLHKLRDVLDHLVGVLERSHPLLDHLGAHHLVVMERDAPILLEAPRPRLADVMEESGKAQNQIRAVLLQVDRLLQDGQRVLVDIFVTVMLVTFQTQSGELRQHLLRQPRTDKLRQTLAGVGGEQQLVELLPDPLGGDDLDTPGHFRHRRDHIGGDIEVQLRGEASSTQHAQRIIGERLLGGAGSAQYTRGQVLTTAVGIDEVLLRKRYRHRVDREVTTDEVFLDGIAVGHLGLARGPVVRLRPVCGDLDLVAVLLDTHGAEGDPDLPYRVGPRPDDLQYGLGAGIGREVQVVPEPAEKRIPDRATDQGEAESGILEAASKVVGDRRHPQQFTDCAVLHLGQGTGAVFIGVRHNTVFIGVRHNRKGYVPGPARSSWFRPALRDSSDHVADSPALGTHAHRYHAGTQQPTTIDTS